MSNVWVVMPSARPVDEVNRVLRLWRERGYKSFVWRDEKAKAQNDDLANALMVTEMEAVGADMVFFGEYPGYASAVNQLIKMLLGSINAHAAPQWFVAAADDIEPDPNKTADEIAWQCSQHFGCMVDETGDGEYAILRGSTFGVMQPTGDRWGAEEAWARKMFPHAPAYIDRICGSAWIGREFIERTYGGKGPFFPGYSHMFADEELQNVAQSLGVLWQRPDLTHKHNHWGRKQGATRADIPPFLVEANSPEHWNKAKALFNERKMAGWPGAIK